MEKEYRISEELFSLRRANYRFLLSVTPGKKATGFLGIREIPKPQFPSFFVERVDTVRAAHGSRHGAVSHTLNQSTGVLHVVAMIVKEPLSAFLRALC